MSREQQQTIWRCDRCGKKSEQPGDRTPPGWSAVERRPYGADPSATDEYDVCDGCGSLVSRLLQPVNKPDNRDALKSTLGSGGPLTEVELVRGYAGQRPDGQS